MLSIRTMPLLMKIAAKLDITPIVEKRLRIGRSVPFTNKDRWNIKRDITGTIDVGGIIVICNRDSSMRLLPLQTEGQYDECTSEGMGITFECIMIYIGNPKHILFFISVGDELLDSFEEDISLHLSTSRRSIEVTDITIALQTGNIGWFRIDLE